MKSFFLKLIIFINIALLAGQFYLTSRRATDGAKISQLDVQLKELSQANFDLKNQIFAYSSLSYIYEKSQNLRLAPAKVSFMPPLSIASINQSNP